jgi:hypothetical protein
MCSQVKTLEELADKICRELKVLCYNDIEDPDLLEKILLFVGTWIENFYYIDPVECVKDIDCVSKILNMHGEVFSLAIRNLYIINIDEDLFRETVEKLLKLSKT